MFLSKAGACPSEAPYCGALPTKDTPNKVTIKQSFTIEWRSALLQKQIIELKWDTEKVNINATLSSGLYYKSFTIVNFAAYLTVVIFALS